MPLKFLLDTNTVSFHLRKSSPALQRRFKRTPASTVALSVVTEMEIRYGLARNPRLRIAPLVEEFLRGITILALDSSAARYYARARGALDARGSPIGPLDLMIASHALASGLVLITNNMAEFTRVPELICEDWTR